MGAVSGVSHGRPAWDWDAKQNLGRQQWRTGGPKMGETYRCRDWIQVERSSRHRLPFLTCGGSFEMKVVEAAAEHVFSWGLWRNDVEENTLLSCLWGPGAFGTSPGGKLRGRERMSFSG